MVFVPIHDFHDLERRLPYARLHRASHFDHIALGSWRGTGDIERPGLPTDFFICTSSAAAEGEIRSSPTRSLLLEELDLELSATTWLSWMRFYGSDKGEGALIDKGFEIDIVDSWESEVEKVATQRENGGEVAVEENGMENC